MRNLIWSLAALCALTATAAADEIHLTNGRTIDGTVRIEGETAIIETGGGITTRIPSKRILKVVTKKTPRQVLAERRAALKKDDLAGHKALARWCEKQKLRREAQALRRAIVARWPNDVESRLALDYVRHDGKWMTREAYMRSLGLVKVGRTWVPKAEASKRAQAEADQAKRKEVRKLLRRVSLDGADRVAARVATYSDAVAVPVLIARGLKSSTIATRRLAAAELGRRKTKRAEAALARTLVADTRGTVRKAALSALRSIKPGATAGKVFMSALTDPNLFLRVHALQGIYAFPNRRAVPVMIARLIETTGGWGTASVSITTQQAYIKDYEVSAGGSGNVVAEVADPVIGTQTTGVVLETKVRAWYRETLVSVLQHVTGQKLGANPQRWKEWWESEGKK